MTQNCLSYSDVDDFIIQYRHAFRNIEYLIPIYTINRRLKGKRA